jgi:hypothetical protein
LLPVALMSALTTEGQSFVTTFAVLAAVPVTPPLKLLETKSD